MFPEASIPPTPSIHVPSVVAIIHISLTTLRQVDSKKIIAYSSVAHMAFVTLGISTSNSQAPEGSILLMLSHGVVSSALSMCVGVLYDRHKTRIIKYYSGMIQVMPIFMTSSPISTPANPSLPTTGGSIGESLVLVGLFQSNKVITFLAATGMVLGAAYSIRS
jgi:NADH-ubiquinone oxidoreductase chain 4